jgi:eukaryotic-like serine/threonine-protein kinase
MSRRPSDPRPRHHGSNELVEDGSGPDDPNPVRPESDAPDQLGGPEKLEPRSSIDSAMGSSDGPVDQLPPPDGSRRGPDLPSREELERIREDHYQHLDREPPDVPGLEVLDRIKGGGMGVIWRARDPEFERDLAVKILRWKLMEPDISGSRAGEERFLKEARITAQLAHPFIAPVHARGRLRDGRPYFTMKLVEKGKTLEKLLDEHPDLDRRRTEFLQKFFAPICQAIAFAHTQDVIHRDLKPSNVMVGDHGEVQVMDWGLAKRLAVPGAPVGPDVETPGAAGAPVEQDNTDSRDLTHAESVLGTAWYMSPESALGHVAQVDRRSDVFGLGAILCEILTGKPPYVGTREEAIQQAKEARLGPAMTRLRGCGAEPELIQLAERCLALDAADRPKDSGEVATYITAYLAAVQERLQQEQVKATEERKRRRVLTVAGGVLVVVSVLLVFEVRLAWIAQKQAQREAVLAWIAQKQAQREAVYSKMDHGHQLCTDGEIGQGMLLMADALEHVPEGNEDAPVRESLRIELSGWRNQCHTLSQVWSHPRQVLSVAVSPDGRMAVTGCADGVIRLWDLESGRRLNEIAGQQGTVNAVAFVPGRAAFVSGGATGSVAVWDVHSGLRMRTRDGHMKGVNAVAVSPDGALALTGSDDKTVRLWDLTDMSCRSTLKHSGAVHAVGFSPDNRSFVTGGVNEVTERGECRLYTIPTFDSKERTPLKHAIIEFERTVRSAAFSPRSGQTLLVGDEHWSASFWDAPSLQQMAIEDYTQGSIRGVAFSADGQTAVTAAYESKDVYMFDVESVRAAWERNRRSRIPLELSRKNSPGPLKPVLRHPKPVTAVAYSPTSDRLFLTACEDGYVRVWRKAAGLLMKRLSHHPKVRDSQPSRREFVVRDADIDAAGKWAATAGWDGKVVLWNVSNGEQAGAPLTHEGRRVMNVTFLPNRPTVLTGDEDGLIHVWDLTSRRQTFAFPHQPGAVSDVSICPEGKEIDISISQDGEEILVGGRGQAQRRNAVSGREIGGPFKHCDDNKCSVNTAISPSKQRFLTAGQDGHAKLWDAEGRVIADLPHQNEVRYCAFSDDGTRLITASDDRNARIWDGWTGNLVATLPHASEVFSAVFTPDGQRVLTGSREGVQMWDVQSRKRIGPVWRATGEVMKVALSRDGSVAVLADWDGYGWIWSVPQPVSGDPASVQRSVQLDVGLIIDGGGGFQVLSGDDWRKLHSPQEAR